MRRVVITGQGAVSALGIGASATMEGLHEGRLGISQLDIPDVGRLHVRIGGQIHAYTPEDNFTRQELTLFDRATQFAMLSAREAMAQSGVRISEENATRTGVVLGTAAGGLHTLDDSYRAVYEAGKNRVHPFVVPRLMNNAAASHISMTYGIEGPSYSVATACASSNHAMGQAFHMIRSGACDVMLTGGSESMLVFGGIKAWEGLRVMSQDACRPFSITRNGMVQGEGAAIFVFEEYESARARGADILAEVIGFAMSSDASDIVMPNRDGAARAMRGALQDARISADSVGYINAHGTGTTANDKIEVAAIRDVFGPHAENLLVSSTKSMHGHLIGGTGAVELLACIMALREGIIPPTIGYEAPDPECNLDVVPNTAREATVTVALSNAFAFGGMNAVLALRAI